MHHYRQRLQSVLAQAPSDPRHHRRRTSRGLARGPGQPIPQEEEEEEEEEYFIYPRLSHQAYL